MEKPFKNIKLGEMQENKESQDIQRSTLNLYFNLIKRNKEYKLSNFDD